MTNLATSLADPNDPLRKVVQSGLESGLERPPLYPEGDGPPFLLWEMRVSSTDREGGVPVVDGGGRIERSAPGRDYLSTARFAVGVGPEALRPLGAERSPDFVRARGGWDEVRGRLEQHVALLRGATLDCLSSLAAGGPGRLGILGGAEVEVRVRIRGWAKQGNAPIVLAEQGLIVRLTDPRDSARGEEIAAGTVAELKGRLEKALASSVSPKMFETWLPLSRRHRDGWRGYEGPVVLAPRAAGWWAHEMAHAALEGVVKPLVASRSGARLVDAPGEAPWPCGFEMDDAGNPARTGVLLGGGAGGRAREGHLRRSSIREAAVPSPSFSRLDPASAGIARAEDIPAGTPVVVAVRSGRLDPVSRTVLLHADRLAEMTADGERSVTGEGVVIVGVDQGWRGLCILDAKGPENPSSALCTRQGRTNPVMVGAPTVVLDRVRVEPR